MARQFSFSSKPPRRPDKAEFWKVFRCRPGQPLKGVVLSHDVVGAQLHWLNNASQPHTEPAESCPGCQAGRPSRWEGYLHCWSPSINQHFLAAFPAGPADEIEAYREKNSTLRGARLQLSKPGMKQQSRVVAELHDSNQPHNALPQAVDVMLVLAHLWKLDKGENLRILIPGEALIEQGSANEDVYVGKEGAA